MREVIDKFRLAHASMSENFSGNAEDAVTEELRIYLLFIGLGSSPKFSDTLSKLSEECITAELLKTISKLDLEHMKIVHCHRIAILNA